MADQAPDIPALVQQLSSVSQEEQARAAQALARLGLEPANRPPIRDAGGISPLVQLLSSSSEDVQAGAASALWTACCGCAPNKAAAAEAGAIPALVRLLGSSSEAVQLKAAGALWNACCGCAPNEAAAAEAGAIPALVRLLGSSSSAEVQRWAVMTVASVCFENPDCQAMMAGAGGIPHLVRLLGSSSAAVQLEAARALRNLCFDSPGSKPAVEAAGAAEALGQLMSSGSAVVQEQAARALTHLCGGDPAATRVAVEAGGGVAPLLGLLDSGSAEVQEWAARAVACLCGSSAADREGVAAAGGIQPLVRLLSSSDFEDVLEQACAALGSLACGSSANRTAIAAAGGLEPLLRLLGCWLEGVQEQAASAVKNLCAGGSASAGLRAQVTAAGGIQALQELLGSSSSEAVRGQARAALRLLDAPASQQSPAPATPERVPPASQPASPSSGDSPVQRTTEQLGRTRLGAGPAAGLGGDTGGAGLGPWEVAYQDLEMGEVIGQGSFGRVHLAHYMQTPVAVKHLLGGVGSEVLSLSSPGLHDLRQEAGIMVNLNHPNCARLLGVCINPAAIITEYYSRHSLHEVIQQARASQAAAGELSWARRLTMALEGARGMLYLHSKGMVHRDLKSCNLLVDDAWHIKVADFNLSTLLQEGGTRSSTNRELNPRWLAPEVLNGGTATPASDVFSFAVVLYELLTWKLPWDHVAQSWQIASNVAQGQRLAVPSPEELPGADTRQFAGLSDYVALMEACWAQEPAVRPTFAAIAQELTQLLTLAPSEGGPPPAKQCCVCLAELPPSELLVLVPCGHRAACQECTQEVLNSRRRQCPMCRAEIRATAPGDFRVFS